MVEPTTTWLLTQGVLGVACVVLLATVGYLWRENSKLRDKMYDHALTMAERMTTALNESTNTIKLLTEKIESSKRSR